MHMLAHTSCAAFGPHLVRSLSMPSAQVVRRAPRWQFVDFGELSAAFLRGEHLMDTHHPAGWLALETVNIYLNLHQQHARAEHSQLVLRLQTRAFR